MRIGTKRGLLLGIAALAVLLLGTSAVFAQNSSSVSDVIAADGFASYFIDLLAGDDITITVVCDEVAPGDRPIDPYFEVEDELGNFIVEDDDSYGSGNGGVDCNAFASSIASFVAPTSGSYFIYIYNLNGQEGGPFTLTVTLNNRGAVSIAGVNSAFTDRRINKQTGAPFVLYCEETVTHVFTVDGTEVGAVEDGESGNGAGWTLAPTAEGRMLFTSAFQDTKPYYFLYDGCPHGRAEALSGNPAIEFDHTSY